MRRRLFLVKAVVFIWLLLCISSGTYADSFIFERIVDSNTAIPGGKKAFTGLHNPTMNDGGLVVFRGRGKSGQRGIYMYKDGILVVVADANTVLPGGAGFLTGVHDLSVNGSGQVVFEGKGSSGRQGIYTYVNGMLAVVADSKTQIPGGTGNFTDLSAPFISDDGQMFFKGDGNNDQRGIYTYVDGILAVVADTHTAIPSGKKFFTNFRHLSFNTEGQGVFSGKGHSAQRGIYIDADGRLDVVADRNTPIPGGTKNFEKFRKPSIDKDGEVAFKAKGRLGQRGIYIDADGRLDVVADRNTPIPGGTGNFFLFGISSIDSGHVAFIGSDDNKEGLYTTLGGSLTKVLSSGDMLDGKRVTTIIFQPDGLSGDKLIFKVIFADSSRGLYRARPYASAR